MKNNTARNPENQGNSYLEAVREILTSPVSMFSGAKNPNPVGVSTLAEILESIKSGKFSAPIARAREALEIGDKNLYDAIKETLAAFTPSCQVHYRGLKAIQAKPKSGPQNLISLSGNITADIDGKAIEGRNLNDLRAVIEADPYVLFCFKSPSGKGLKVGLWSPNINTIEDHENFYFSVERYFKEKYDVAIDEKCKDAARLCFMSDDPLLVLNPEADPFSVENYAAKAKPKPEPPPHPGPGTNSPYGRAALEDECRKVSTALELTRNDTLNKAALKIGHYVGGGILTYAEVETALLNAATACGLLERDARATIQSGLAAGIQEPRTPPNNDKYSSHERTRTEPPKDDEWQEPEPLPDALRPVENFHESLLPTALRPWVKDNAERMQCPMDFVGVGAVVALGSVIGRRVCIRPKCYDDFSVIPNLWGCMIGPPSAMKSPAGDEVMKPIKRLEIEAKEAYEAGKKDYDKALLMAKLQQELDKDRVKKELKAGKSFAEIPLNSVDENAGDEPVRPRFYTSEPTIEKLGVTMMENPGGVLLYRDELYGWFKNLSREDRANDRAFYLETWSGTGRYTFDRIGRGTVDVEHTSLSIWGGIQPGRMASVIRGAVHGGADDDGLAPRFGMVVYPDIQKEFKIVDRWPDKEAKALAFDVFKRLAALPVPATGQDIPVMRFDEPAQKLFFEWWIELETELRSGELHPAIEKHLTKYRKLIPALALICHLAEDIEIEIPRPGHDDTHGIVPLPALKMALGWYEYLRSHAERVYGLAISGNMAAAKSLLRKLVSGKLQRPFTKRDIKRPCWTGLSEDEDVSMAVNTLIEYGYLAKTLPPVSPAGGRPSEKYYLNPKVAR